MMRKCLCTASALVFSIVVAACGSSSNPSGVTSHGPGGSSKQYAELRWGSLAFPGALSSRANGWPPTYMIESLVVQRLVEYESSGKLKLGLASSIEHPNSTTYIYNVRSGVKFSDGKPLTVADVLYSLKQNFAKEADTKSFWEPEVASVAAHGSTAVVIKLKHPDVNWPSIMGLSSQIVEKAAAERAGGLKAQGTSTQTLPIGTGPWQFDSYTANVGVRLSRNPYWDGSPQPASKIAFTFFKDEGEMALALRSGAIDGAMDYDDPKLFSVIPGTVDLLNPAELVWLPDHEYGHATLQQYPRAQGYRLRDRR